MKKGLAYMAALFIVSSMLSVIGPKATVHAGSNGLTLTTPTHELSWTLGEPYPNINGFAIFPTLAPSAPPPANSAPWYAGSVFPSSSGTQNARTIYMSIMVPNSAPLSDEFYYVLLSAWDSAGSYDQIGFSDDYGTWGLTYSWTSGPPSNPTYHSSPNAIALSVGTTYTFYITTQSGVTHFIAYQGSTQVWSLDAPTGGNYLILSNSYAGYYDYTDYEEIWQTHTSGGSPAFYFYFYDQYWVSTSGSTNAATWTTFFSGAPSGVAVEIIGNSVLVENPNALEPVAAMKTGMDGYFYVPQAAHINLLRMQLLFNNPNLVGDQNGGTSPYATISYYPDGKVNIVDIGFIGKKYGLSEGQSGWDYMADVVPDRTIDMQDLSAASKNFDKTGTYITDLSGATVKFNTGQVGSPNADGFIQIPHGATSFNVLRNGNSIGAMTIFW